MNLDRDLLRQARQSRLALFITILLGFAASLLTVLQAGLLSKVVDQVFLGGADTSDGGKNQLTLLLAIILVVIFLRAGLAWGSEISAGAIARRVKSSLRDQIFRRLQERGPVAARQESTGELASVLVEAIETLDAYYSQYLPQLVLAALVPVTLLLVVFPIDWVSGLVLLLTAPLIPIFMVLIGNMAQALTQHQWVALSRMNAYFLDVIQGITTLKIFGRSQAQTNILGEVSERYRQATMSVLRVTFLSALVLELVSTLSTAVVAVEVGLRLLYGRLSFEQAFFVLLLAPEFYLPLRLLGTRFHAGMSGLAAARRIFQVLNPDDRIEDVDLHTAYSESAGIPLAYTSLQFKQVSFSYGDERPALQQVSFEILAGQKVALVGPSGGGKTTIAQLLLRFIEPTHGVILLDGKPLQDFNLAAWRQQVAWVSQNPYLFQDTILENIRLGKPGASFEEVLQAARWAHADEFVRMMPGGYDALVGERGTGLSAGQAQRIALARAFLKNASFVILDEATASLDPETQALIQDSLDNLLAGRTALIIAHRLNTVAEADKIIVLDAGQVVEAGSHAELLMNGGLYQRLVTAYRSDGEVLPYRSIPEVSFESHKPGWLPSDSHYSFLPVDGTDYSTPQRQERLPKILCRMLGLVWPFRWLVGLSVLAGVATIASGVGLMSTSAYLISAAALHPSIAELQVAIVGVRFFGLARGVFRYLERYLSHQATFRVLGKLRVTFYKALEPLAPARLAQFHSGDLLARISGDIESLENFYVRAVAPPLVAIVITIGMTLLMSLLVGPRQGLALFSLMLIAGVGLPFLVRWISRRPGRRLVELRAALSATLVDGIQGMAELAAYDQSDRQFQKVRWINADLNQQQAQLVVIGGFQSGMLSLLTNLGMWSVLVLTIPQVINGELPGVYLAVAALAALSGFEAVTPLPVAAQVLESNLQSARRLFELIDAQPEVDDPSEPLPLPEIAVNSPELQVQELGFTYPSWRVATSSGVEPESKATQRLDQQLRALAGISFDLPYGKRLAIVGPSGAGKSTLVSLLLRFWDYPEGAIRINGNELRRYRPEDIRRLMAVVSQDTTLFNATVRDNLFLARPGASQAELEEAAELAQLHQFISDLPQGYDTWIGEGGARLSAGQRQRLAIARAILKNAPILILDEPTANLDALTERELNHAMLQMARGRSMLLITHRLFGLEQMDEILVLRQGRLIERGTHHELLAREGYYRKMYDLQQSAFD